MGLLENQVNTLKKVVPSVLIMLKYCHKQLFWQSTSALFPLAKIPT